MPIGVQKERNRNAYSQMLDRCGRRDRGIDKKRPAKILPKTANFIRHFAVLFSRNEEE